MNIKLFIEKYINTWTHLKINICNFKSMKKKILQDDRIKFVYVIIKKQDGFILQN